MMTARDIIDVLSNGCNQRTQALIIMRRKGMFAAIDYLQQFHTERLDRYKIIDTKEYARDIIRDYG